MKIKVTLGLVYIIGSCSGSVPESPSPVGTRQVAVTIPANVVEGLAGYQDADWDLLNDAVKLQASTGDVPSHLARLLRDSEELCARFEDGSAPDKARAHNARFTIGTAISQLNQLLEAQGGSNPMAERISQFDQDESNGGWASLTVLADLHSMDGALPSPIRANVAATIRKYCSENPFADHFLKRAGLKD